MLRLMLIVAVCGPWLLSSASAQQYQQAQVVGQQSIQRQTSEIVPGQSLDEVVAILRHHGKEFGGPWFAFSQRPGEVKVDHLGIALDPEHTAAAIFYPVDSKRVTSISINLKPSRQSGKADQFWMSARKITLHPDGSYSIQFEPPVAR